MDITSRKRTRIVTLSQHTSMTVRNISAAVGVGQFTVCRIINQQKNFGAMSPKRKSKCVRKPGIFARKPIEKQLLTSAIKTKCLDWGRKYQSWTAQDWKKDILSDEMHFLCASVSTNFSQTKSVEPIRKQHLVKRVKQPQK
ncbi:hypothetical protein TNCV_4901951 [Trichonephila clavipes]|nr:hypothetical protein TNCV_4901951 [Trichonephila clavipes]